MPMPKSTSKSTSKSASVSAPRPGPEFEPESRLASAPRAFEHICAHIQGAVAQGDLVQGDKLPPERELAEFYGVSRVVVREALRNLEKAGLVVLRRGTRGGAFIQALGEARLTDWMRDILDYGKVPLNDLTEARIYVLEAVAHLACERATEADLDLIEENVRLNEQLLETGDSTARTHHAVEFYARLAAAAKNQVLAMVVKSLTEILMNVLTQIRPYPSRELVESRKLLMRKLRARDASGAARQLRNHLRKLHDYIETERARQA